MSSPWEPLTREQVRAVIEGRGAGPRVPIGIHMWVHPDQFGDRQGKVEEILQRYPNDIQTVKLATPGVYDPPADDAEYRWMNCPAPPNYGAQAYDQNVAIDDWAKLDDVLAVFPDQNYAGLLNNIPPADDRYRLAVWWYCLFERHWSLRGMTNALMDFYTDPESVHKLYAAFTDIYVRWIERTAEAGADGVFTSDDIGMQTGPFFSVEIFREFFKPYYRRIIDAAHSRGMHFWLHTCRDIESFLPDFIEIGLDVIHPIQKYTMDEKHIAEKFGDQITFWAGFDVQQTIPWGSAEEVRQEVRFMLDTYYRTDGRLMFTAGNGVNGDCPITSLDALFDESIRYGTKVAGGAGS